MTAADRLNEIQARAEKATHGPWEVQEEEWAVISSGSDSVLHAFAVEKDCIECGTPQDECDTEVVLDIEDVEFIAHARSDVPALVAALRAVLDLHRKGTIYYHADHCDNPSDEHIAERHDEYSDAMGEYYCRDLPMHDVCRECSGVFDDEFESVEFPCPTVRAVEAALGEVAP